jgi:hypothetical protein
VKKPSALAAGLRNAGATVAAPSNIPPVTLAGELGGNATTPPIQVLQPSVEGERTKAPVPPSRLGTKAITVHLPSIVRRQLKGLAADLERDVQDLVSEGLNLIFARYGRPEIAPTKSTDP